MLQIHECNGDYLNAIARLAGNQFVQLAIVDSFSVNTCTSMAIALAFASFHIVCAQMGPFVHNDKEMCIA